MILNIFYDSLFLMADEALFLKLMTEHDQKVLLGRENRLPAGQMNSNKTGYKKCLRSYVISRFTGNTKSYDGIWIVSKIWVKDAVGNTRSYSSSELTSMGFPTELDVRSSCNDGGGWDFWDESDWWLFVPCFVHLTSASVQWTKTEVFGVNSHFWRPLHVAARNKIASASE